MTMQPQPSLKLPSALEAQLLEFRRRVWTIKSLEANKASLPTAMQSQVANLRTMLDSAKKGLGATTLPAVPKL